MSESKSTRKQDLQSSGGFCPVCSRPAAHRWRPFCSKRCADVDLGRWLKGSYRIPISERPAEHAEDSVRADEEENEG